MSAWPARHTHLPTYAGMDITDVGGSQRQIFSDTATPANAPYVYVQDELSDSPEFPPPRSITPPSSTTRSSTDTPTSRTLSTSPPTHLTPPSSTSPPSIFPVHSRTTPPSRTTPSSSTSPPSNFPIHTRTTPLSGATLRSSASPPSKAVYAQISPYLSYPADGSSSPFTYNLTYPLHSEASIAADPHLYADPVLEEEIKREPAFNATPPLSQVTIIFPQLPPAHQRVVIESRKPLSVFDVMDGIHNHLRTKLTEDDCRSLRLNWGLVRQQMERRLDRILDNGVCEAEARRGVIALDLLDDKRRFLGLSSTAEGSGVWKLHTF